MFELHCFLCFSLLFCAYLMCMCTNPIESVLFLILAFFNAAGILFIFHAEFLGLLFIIIYVGAIAVLFLFVIMMLNIKNLNNTSKLWFAGFYGVFSLAFCVIQLFGINFGISNNSIDFQLMIPIVEKISIDNLNNIDIMGQVLFNYYLVAFLLAGIVLLIALIGAIVLTLRFNNIENNQLVNRQLARTENNLSFFKKGKND